MAIFLEVVLLIASVAFLRVQSQCTVEWLEQPSNLMPIMADALISGQGSPALPTIMIHDQNIVCLAASSTRGLYAEASVILNFTCSPMSSNPVCTNQPVLRQFRFTCNNNAWGPGTSTPDYLVTVPNGTLTTPRRTNCRVCVDPGTGSSPDPATHCVSCPGTCTGLNFCVSTTCCNFYDNSTCVLECPTNRFPTSDFICSDPCVELNVPMSGTVTYSNDTRKVGTVATYNCNNNLVFVGDSRTRTCRVDNETNIFWDGNDGKCADVCVELNVPKNGTVTYSNDTREVGTVATYNCNSNLVFVGDSTTRTCRLRNETNTFWDGNEGKCVVDCGSLPQPIDGLISYSSGTIFQSVATYSCKDDLELNGPRTRMCLDSGVWSQADKKVQCDKKTISVGAIVGIVIGIVIALIIIAILVIIIIVYVVLKNKKKDMSDDLTGTDGKKGEKLELDT